jgi:hypothetical protein
MISKIILILLALTLTATSYGADDQNKALKYVKEKFDLAYHGEFYYKHNAEDRELRDYSNLNNPSLVYRPVKNIKFSASAEFKYADYQLAGYPNRFYRALYSLTRENVLTEKENGVKLDVGIARRVFDRKAVPGTFGNTRLTTSWSRALPGGIGKNTGSLFAQYLYNDPKNIVATTWKHSIELIPAINFVLNDKLTFSVTDDMVFNTPWKSNTAHDLSLNHEAYATWTYKHNDKISPYFQLKYTHTEDFTAAGFDDSDLYEYFIGVGYTLNSKVTLTPEIGHKITESGDKNILVNHVTSFFNQIDLALYVDITF